MFDLSLAEVALVIVVAVVFIGPKEMPTVIRGAAKTMRAVRGLGRDIRKTFDELAEESGLKDTTDEINAEIRLIKGDDGKMYESYMMPEEKKRHEG